MDTLNRDQLFSLFRSAVHENLNKALDSANVIGIAAYEAADHSRSAMPITRGKKINRADEGYTLIGVYMKEGEVVSGSRTQAALDWLKANEGKSAYAAAKKFGISTRAVTAALKRRSGKPICPCCGQVIRSN